MYFYNYLLICNNLEEKQKRKKKSWHGRLDTADRRGQMFHTGPFKMSFRRIFHVYTGGYFVVVVLKKQQKYTFNSTVNVEIMSKMFENINKSNFVAKYLK